MNTTKQNKSISARKWYRRMFFYLIEKHMQKFRHFWRKNFKFPLKKSLTSLLHQAIQLMCNTEPISFFPLTAVHFPVYIIPSSCITRWYLYNLLYTTMSKFVQLVKDHVWLFECSPPSCQAPRNNCEEKHKKFITRRIHNKSPSHFSFDTCRHLLLSGTVRHSKKLIC